MCFEIRSIRFFFFCDTTKNLEKPPKIQSKFEFMNEQVPKFSFKKLIHLSTQNLNLGLEFKTGQNHPVNRTKKNTELVPPFPNVLATPSIRSPVFVKCIVFMALTGLKMYLNRCGAKIFIGHLMRTATLVSIFLIATQPIRI